MPNPLSTVHPGAGYVLASIGSYPLSSNEHLARLAMEAISAWANVDLNMLQVYITLAGGGSADAAAVFLSIESDGARKSAITALADIHLKEDQKKLFRAILKVMGQRAKDRHKLAHWVWGYSAMLPDALLLADPRWLAKREPTKAPQELSAYHSAMEDNIFVYKEADFTTIIKNSEAVASHACLFNWIIQKHPANAGGRLWQKISEAPEIAEILNPPDQKRQTPPEEER